MLGGGVVLAHGEHGGLWCAIGSAAKLPHNIPSKVMAGVW
jgi:hypothetical protein